MASSDSGDAIKNGIGAMTDERMADFFEKMVSAGVVKSKYRLSPGLHAALRQQGGRRRVQAEELTVRTRDEI
jgi:hypothetical protein